MLSDIFMKKDTKGETSEINTQIKRLENLSISMSNLIASGNSDKIMHLEKIRKKIITDIISTKKVIPSEHKDAFKNLIHLNDKIINEMRVHTFDLNQHKTTFDDWNKAFAQSIYKRTKYAKCGVFIGMSGGYDSGAIACELTNQNIDFTAYSISNVEDETVMKQRKDIVKNANLIQLEREDFLKARKFLKDNAEEYYLNFDNGEKDKYNELIKEENYNKTRANDLLKIIEFRKTGQIVTDDNGGIGCSHICSLAKQ